jgi:hypothetical protein
MFGIDREAERKVIRAELERLQREISAWRDACNEMGIRAEYRAEKAAAKAANYQVDDK